LVDFSTNLGIKDEHKSEISDMTIKELGLQNVKNT